MLIFMDILDTKKQAISGAFVADVASLGFHWLYEPDHIQALSGDEPEFRAPDRADFDGKKGYFAHPEKKVGDMTHYGAGLLVAVKCLEGQESNVFDVLCYQDTFVQAFERGGWWQGYIDTPTRVTLDNIRAAKEALGDGDILERADFGADDEQIPAFTKVPPIVAAFAGHDEMLPYVEEAVRVTNNNDEAVMYSLFAARALEAVIQGASIDDALMQAFEASDWDEKGQRKMQAAFDSDMTDPLELGPKFGMTCHLYQAIPLSVALLRNASADYKAGVRANILAGGDQAGRGIFIGAMLGAAHGVPTDWIEKVSEPKLKSYL